MTRPMEFSARLQPFSDGRFRICLGVYPCPASIICGDLLFGSSYGAFCQPVEVTAGALAVASRAVVATAEERANVDGACEPGADAAGFAAEASRPLLLARRPHEYLLVGSGTEKNNSIAGDARWSG